MSWFSFGFNQFFDFIELTIKNQDNQGEAEEIGNSFPKKVINQLDSNKIVVPASATELVNRGLINPWQTRVCLLLHSLYAVFDVFTG